MEIADIVQKLQDLQIQKGQLLTKLAAKYSVPISSNKVIEVPNTRSRDSRAWQPGDNIILLTGGVITRKGGLAKVTKLMETNMHFVVIRNGQSMYKKKKKKHKHIIITIASTGLSAIDSSKSSTITISLKKKPIIKEEEPIIKSVLQTTDQDSCPR